MNPSDCPVAENNVVHAGGEDAELHIESKDGRAVRFALLPHVKPVLLMCEDDSFSIGLLSLQYTNVNPKTGGYEKDPKTGQFPPAEWRVGYVILSRHEFWSLCQLREDDNYEKLYGCDLVMSVWPEMQQTHINIKNLRPCWTREPEVAKEVEEAARKLAPGLVERLGREVSVKAAVKASIEDWKGLEERARPTWKEYVEMPYSLALVDQAAEDFPGFGERCRKVLGGAWARETFLMDDATAFMQLDYLAHGSDALHDPNGNEPAANFFLDTTCGEGIRAIEKFAQECNLKFSTARAVLMASIARTMRIDLMGKDKCGASLDDVEEL
jgi:hypothetical protein